MIKKLNKISTIHEINAHNERPVHYTAMKIGTLFLGGWAVTVHLNLIQRGWDWGECPSSQTAPLSNNITTKSNVSVLHVHSQLYSTKYWRNIAGRPVAIRGTGGPKLPLNCLLAPNLTYFVDLICDWRRPTSKTSQVAVQTTKFSASSAHSIVLYPTLKTVALPVVVTVSWISLPLIIASLLKPGFHYPSWRPELTAQVDGWPVSISIPTRPSRRPVNSGSGNRA